MATEQWTDKTILQPNEKIARIEKTFLGIEDHGILTCWLNVSYGSSAQGIGGYSLDAPGQITEVDGKRGPRQATIACGQWVLGILNCCGVDSWEKVAGRSIIVTFETAEYNSLPVSIRPLPTERGVPFHFRKEMQDGDKKNHRLWVNKGRTVLFRFWEDGPAEYATRESEAHVWGAPIAMIEEKT